MKIFIFLCTLITFISCVQYINFYYYALEMFDTHQKYRVLHGLNNTKYDDNIAAIALEQAVRMADNMRFYYSNSTYNGRNMGENFFFCNTFDGNSCLPLWDVTWYWYKEYYNYCFSTKSFPLTARNFITMVWKETTLMGCGIEYRRYWDCMDAYFIVCDYYPGPPPTFGPTAEEIAENLIDRTAEDDEEKNPEPC